MKPWCTDFLAMPTGLQPQRGRVVVVETDDLIRDLLTRWLADAGYAVAVDESQSPAPALVIADVPGPARAAEMLQRLRMRYAAPVLLISGRFRRGLGASADMAKRLGARGLLPKPFTRDELLAAVRESLGNH